MGALKYEAFVCFWMILSHFDDLSPSVSSILPALEIAKLEAKSPKVLCIPINLHRSS